MTDRSDYRRDDTEREAAVLGLGYVGLPLAVALAETRSVDSVVGYDPDPDRIERYRSGTDPIDAVGDDTVAKTSVSFTDEEDALVPADGYSVAVPTPAGRENVPDLRHVRDAVVFAAARDPFGTLDFDRMHREMNDDPVWWTRRGPSATRRGLPASTIGDSEAMQGGVTASNVAATSGAAGVAASGWADVGAAAMGEVPAR